MTNKKAISKTKCFWIADKRAISKDMVLTLGFIILAAMSIMAGMNLIAPLVRNTPEYTTFSIAKVVDSVIASPENVIVTVSFSKNKIDEGGLFGLGILRESIGLYIKIDGTNICMSEDTSGANPKKACYKFNEDNSLKVDVKKDKFVGKMIIEKKEGVLIFR